MKKSELKKYIRENIISELSESTEDEINKTKELTQAVQDLESAKKEAGIEESVNEAASLVDEVTGKAVKLPYKTKDFRGDAITVKGFTEPHKSSSSGRIQTDQGEFFPGVAGVKIVGHKFEGVTEDEDKEPSKSDIKKTKGLAKAKEELALLTREMKSLAKKYSKAEGADKEKLVKILKDKTKLKKELESILDNKKI